jgi:4-amino-4-deoxy-L-arabinose transferase-like glycosyltransferase
MWPESPEVAWLLPWLLAFSLYWAGVHSMLLFDGLMALWTLLAWTGMWQAVRRPRPGFLWVGVGLGLGLLTKGPIILLFVLPPALLAPLWHPFWPGWPVWGAGLGRALGLMALIALIWGLPVIFLGGKDYAADLLWRQSAGRALESFAHRRPWWWYLPILPLMLLPWSLIPANYRALGRIGGLVGSDQGVRFCLAAFVPGVVLCSLISGKQPHYLLPLIPALMLLLSRGMVGMSLRFSLRPLAGAVLLLALILTVTPLWMWFRGKNSWVADISPLWGLSLLPVFWAMWRLPPAGFLRQIPVMGAAIALLLMFAHLSVIREAQSRFDLTEASRMLGALERNGHPLAFVGTYRGQFQFLGRLERTPALLKAHEDARVWAVQNPHGIVIDEVDHARDCLAPPSILCRPYRGHYLVVREATQLVPKDVNAPMF